MYVCIPCFGLFSLISKELDRNFVSLSLQYQETREKCVNFKDDVFSGLQVYQFPKAAITKHEKLYDADRISLLSLFTVNQFNYC